MISNLFFQENNSGDIRMCQYKWGCIVFANEYILEVFKILLLNLTLGEI